MVITPVDMTLPGPEPDKAPINPDATTAAYPAPPGSLPSKARIKFTAPSMIFVFVIIADIQIKTTMEYSSEVDRPLSIKLQRLPHVPVTATKTRKANPMDSQIGLFIRINQTQITPSMINK